MDERCAKAGCWQPPHPHTIYCLKHHHPRCALADWRADGDEECTCATHEAEDRHEEER